MRISYDKDLRQEARKTGKRLYTYHVTGPGGKGGIKVQGLYDADTMKEIQGYTDSVFKVIK